MNFALNCMSGMGESSPGVELGTYSGSGGEGVSRCNGEPGGAGPCGLSRGNEDARVPSLTSSGVYESNFIAH